MHKLKNQILKQARYISIQYINLNFVFFSMEMTERFHSNAVFLNFA